VVGGDQDRAAHGDHRLRLAAVGGHPAPTVTSAPTATAAASPTPAPSPTPTVDQLWELLLPRLDPLWGHDWPQAIGLLEPFRARFPDFAPARDKLYAALVSYGADLIAAGTPEQAVDPLERAQAVDPQRGEAGAALLALTPTPTPEPPPPPAPVRLPPRRPTPAPVRPAPPAPVAQPTAPPRKTPFVPPAAQKTPFVPPAAGRS